MRPAACLIVFACLAACVEVRPGSRDARALAPRMLYPAGAWPVTSVFEDPHDSRGRRRRTAHAGVDIRAPVGTPVVAAAAGTVQVVEDAGAGRTVLLTATDTPEPMLMEFAHLESVSVKTGDTVARGQVIAAVGRSGRDSGGVAHLHFGVQPVGGDVTDPVPLLVGSQGVVCAGDSDSKSPRTVLTYPVACTRGR